MAFDGLNCSDIKSDSEKVNKEVTMVNHSRIPFWKKSLTMRYIAILSSSIPVFVAGEVCSESSNAFCEALICSGSICDADTGLCSGSGVACDCNEVEEISIVHGVAESPVEFDGSVDSLPDSSEEIVGELSETSVPPLYSLPTPKVIDGSTETATLEPTATTTSPERTTPKSSTPWFISSSTYTTSSPPTSSQSPIPPLAAPSLRLGH